MTLRESLDAGAARLDAGPHPGRARRDAETLLLHLTGKNRAWLLAHLDDPFGGCTAIQFAALLSRRLAGEPIQYITGEVEFYGLPFHITPAVLIPRPETEHLVEQAIALATIMPGAPSMESATSGRHGWETTSSSTDRVPQVSQRPGKETPATWSGSILDIGTGSGAIAVALAHHLPHAHITAIDLSAQALSIAEENAKRNGVSIRFLRGDLLAPVSSETFDLIVSNPPYVASADRDALAVEVRDYEPAQALFAGDNGLDVYRRLIPAAFHSLVHGGFLALEIGYGQAPAVQDLLSSAGFHQIETIADLQGFPRVLASLRP